MTRRAMWVALSLMLLAVPALEGCAAEPAQPALNDTEWLLVEWGQPGNLHPALETGTVTLSFSGASQVTGNAGCNAYGGSYTSSTSGTLSFRDLFSTEMYCTEPGVMQQEQGFLDALAAAERYEVSDGLLRISGGGMELVLTSA